MTKSQNLQADIFESLLPFADIEIEPKLKKIDQALKDDPLILRELYDIISKRHKYSKTLGRHSTAVETVLRMLIIRHYFNWSFRDTEQFVKDSFSLRHFARIYFDKVPDHTVLSRYKKLIPDATLKKINKKIVKIAQAKKVTKGRKLRVDTTVVETNIHYPSDSSLLADGVRVLARLVSKVKQTGIATGTLVRDFRRSAKRQVLNIVKFARSNSQSAQQSFKKSYRQLIDITKHAVNNAKTLKRTLVNRARGLGFEASLVAQHVKEQLDHYLPLIEQVIFQSESRIFGGQSLANDKKIISIFEPHSYVIRKGKRHKPNEFGQLVKIQEADGGIITDYERYNHYVADTDLFNPSLDRHIETFGRPPYLAAADRGFHSKTNEQLAYEKGVKRVCLPQKGKKSKQRQQLEKSRWFKAGQRFRAGCEGRISVLKRGHGLDRCLDKGENGFDQWLGWGVIAANLKVIAAN